MTSLPPISFGNISLGDATGFFALIFIGLSSMFMLLRTKLLKFTKNIVAIRVTHIGISALAGVFLVIHVAYLFAGRLTVHSVAGDIEVVRPTGSVEAY